MKLNATYFLKNSLLGSSVIHDEPDIGVPCVHSLAYFCSSCGDIWARAAVTGATWHAVQAPCEKHSFQGVQDFNRIPGSLLHPRLTVSLLARMDWAQSIEALPNSALKRELLLTLAQREQQNALSPYTR